MSTTSTKKNGIKVSSSQASKQVIENKPKPKISTRVLPSSVRKEENDKTKSKTISKSLKKPDNDDEEKLIKPRIISQRTSVQNKISSSRNLSKIKQEKPTTPPSNRVTKTQFFPSKKLYSNALKINENKSKDLDNKIKKETILPTKSTRKSTTSTIQSTRKREVNKTIVSNNSSPEVSTISERPGTATLRKGSIVNTNIVGPDAPKSKVVINKKQIPNTSSSKVVEKAPSPKPPSPEAADYEDDFDSYESDFEGYQSSESSSTSFNVSEISNEIPSSTSSISSTELKSAQKRVNSGSTDDEKKLDSGNYELPENRHKQILDNIKEAIEKENANLGNKQNQQSNLASLSDEGFEDAKSLQFINFLGAQKKYQHRRSIEKQRKRGEEILSMIRLDTFSFTLLDLPPVPYEIFIKNFGKSNTVQISVQTGEDNISDETQTEEIDELNKWTQCPAVLSQIDEKNPNFWNIYKNNYLGVGAELDENIVEKDNITENYNENKLENFLLSAGNLILNIQAEHNSFINEISENSSSDIPFSKEHILFETQSHEILKNRSVNNVCICKDNPNKILTVHNKLKNEISKDSIICLWHISNAKEPEMLLTAYGEITCCSFGLDSVDLVFGGLDDGSIAIWDTKENSKHHKIITNEQITLLRTPTYTTGIQNGHNFKIVSIHSLPSSSSNKNHLIHNQTKEICSLDEKGEIIIWSIIIKHLQNKGQLIENQGLAHWGVVMLVKSRQISLRKLHPHFDCLHCTDSIVNYLDPNHIYISTNYGFIMHCMLNGARSSVQKFLPSTSQSEANCLETCPFSPLYILCGFDNGNLSFYSRSLERPLMTMSDKDCNTSKCNIQLIQWSYNRPLVFYTKDITNTIHIWDLKASDMFPTYSIPFKENIVCMKLSPTKYEDKENQKTYMLIATESGAIYLYFLNDEHGKQSFELYKEDTRKFLNYINRYV